MLYFRLLKKCDHELLSCFCLTSREKLVFTIRIHVKLGQQQTLAFRKLDYF